jgi:hypothetical protein
LDVDRNLPLRGCTLHKDQPKKERQGARVKHSHRADVTGIARRSKHRPACERKRRRGPTRVGRGQRRGRERARRETQHAPRRLPRRPRRFPLRPRQVPHGPRRLQVRSFVVQVRTFILPRSNFILRARLPGPAGSRRSPSDSLCVAFAMRAFRVTSSRDAAD